MIPVLLRLGPITVYSYGLMMALGFIAADLVCTSEFKRRQLNPEQASMLVLWTAIAGIVGARLWDVFDNWSSYMAHPSSIVFSGAGFVWYGGLAGGILASFIVVRYYGLKWLMAADIAAPAIAIGHAFGRMGCLLSGDGDWGTPSNLPWAMRFPHAIVGWTGRTVLTVNRFDQLVPAPGCTDTGCSPWVRVHPAPIYEAILYTAIFLLLMKLGRKAHVDGRIFYLFLVLSGAARFAVEFVRVNPRVAFGLTEYQLTALVMMVVGAGAYLWSVAGQASPASKQEAA